MDNIIIWILLNIILYNMLRVKLKVQYIGKIKNHNIFFLKGSRRDRKFDRRGKWRRRRWCIAAFVRIARQVYRVTWPLASTDSWSGGDDCDRRTPTVAACCSIASTSITDGDRRVPRSADTAQQVWCRSQGTQFAESVAGGGG